MVNVAVVGCTHGELDAVYAKVDQLNEEASASPSERIKLIICCGDFECLRNANDLKCKASPPKYRHMNAFHQYYRGEKHASVLTVFIGGNHEASNYLQELHYGGWVAPNIFYLGAAGVINVAGLRIAGVSGIYHAKHYHKGHFEKAPYSKKTIDSVFCVREFEIFQLSHLVRSEPTAHSRTEESSSDKSYPCLDAFLSHDWPTHIENHGDIAALLKERPGFKRSIATNRFGNPGSERLLHTLQPAMWLAGHMHVRFEATVQHAASGSEGSIGNAAGQEHATHFLGLSKCFPGEACLEVVDLAAQETRSDGRRCEDDDRIRVMMDVEWLAILRATHHLASRSRGDVPLPSAKLAIAMEVEWVEKRLDEVYNSQTLLGKVKGEWITDFVVTAPPLGEESATTPDFDLGNPQTDSLLAFLELPHVITRPYKQ